MYSYQPFFETILFGILIEDISNEKTRPLIVNKWPIYYKLYFIPLVKSLSYSYQCSL